MVKRCKELRAEQEADSEHPDHGSEAARGDKESDCIEREEEGRGSEEYVTSSSDSEGSEVTLPTLCPFRSVGGTGVS